MECESTISFDTKCADKAKHIVQAFNAFESVSLSSLTDIEIRKDKSNAALKRAEVNLQAEDIFKHLVELDTGVTETAVDGSKVSFDIFPISFPEYFCDFIFPRFNDCGFKDVKCESNSEYGVQILKFHNGKIVKAEDIFDI